MSEPLGAAIGRGPISEASPPQFLATNMEIILSTVERGSNCHLTPVIKLASFWSLLYGDTVPPELLIGGGRGVVTKSSMLGST